MLHIQKRVMGFRSIELPNVGTKYELETEEKDKIAIIFLKTGKIQFYILSKECDEPYVVNLTPAEARRLGNILTGAIFESMEESVEIAFSALADLRILVHTYKVGKNIAGKSIEELEIRKKTGVTIIAVSRKGKNIVSPPPSFVFEEGDIIVAIGEHDQIRAFEKEILGV